MFGIKLYNETQYAKKMNHLIIIKTSTVFESICHHSLQISIFFFQNVAEMFEMIT